MIKAPFRPFFLLAALDAMLGGAVWVVPGHLLDQTGISAGSWHRDVILFGTLAAILAGFLLTALPRWTGQKPVSPAAVKALSGHWGLSRVVFVLLDRTLGLALFAVFSLIVLLVLARAVALGRDWRNLKVLAMLAIYVVATMLAALNWQADLALRLALAAILGLVIMIAGRVVPALTQAYLQSVGQPALQPRTPGLDKAVELTAVGSLIGWVLVPRSPWIGPASGVAACVLAAQLVIWRSWRVGDCMAILVLHLGYLWIAIGFALLAASLVLPSTIGPLAAVHAWTTGATATLAMGIMASIARKHCKRSFTSSRLATTSFLMITVAAALRQASEIFCDEPFFALLAGGCWVAAFALFAVFFEQLLWRGAIFHRA